MTDSKTLKAEAFKDEKVKAAYESMADKRSASVVGFFKEVM